jgi:hypothetical protein
MDFKKKAPKKKKKNEAKLTFAISSSFRFPQFSLKPNKKTKQRLEDRTH